MASLILINIGSGNDLKSYGTKPLPEPMLSWLITNGSLWHSLQGNFTGGVQITHLTLYFRAVVASLYFSSSLFTLSSLNFKPKEATSKVERKPWPCIQQCEEMSAYVCKRCKKVFIMMSILWTIKTKYSELKKIYQKLQTVLSGGKYQGSWFP